jgi:DNA-binding response OmpR family regulator
METFANDQMWNTQRQASRLNFALVIGEANHLRHSVIELLREHGWLVHGVGRAEQALSILIHIPYNLIVLDSELPGMSAPDFVRMLRHSRERQTIRLVVINNSESANWESQVAKCDAFLAKRSTWQDELFGFLVAHGEDSRMGNACSQL